MIFLLSYGGMIVGSGKLYIVATPIGNLGDITYRAAEILAFVDVIACEDTRVSKRLVDHLKLRKELISYHHHSGGGKIRQLKDMLAEGKNVALITDAGTPGVSDPGNELVQQIITTFGGASVVPIPGASALTAALSVCGFPTDRLLFLGFPPHKHKRNHFFSEVAASAYTVVFFESNHRIIKCLADLASALPPRAEVVVCRELTKQFETIYRGTIAEVTAAITITKGEFVVVVNNHL